MIVRDLGLRNSSFPLLLKDFWVICSQKDYLYKSPTSPKKKGRVAQYFIHSSLQRLSFFQNPPSNLILYSKRSPDDGPFFTFFVNYGLKLESFSTKWPRKLILNPIWLNFWIFNQFWKKIDQEQNLPSVTYSSQIFLWTIYSFDL